MAETRNPAELPTSAKRKTDDSESHSQKSQKLGPLPNQENQSNGNRMGASGNVYSAIPEENGREEAEVGAEAEDGEVYESGDESGGDAVIDRKGKGILMEEEEDSDDDEDEDSSDGRSEEDGGSDLSDDPLTEVDLDNILPSRTRRRTVEPGAYISTDMIDNDDDDSEASDA